MYKDFRVKRSPYTFVLTLIASAVFILYSGQIFDEMVVLRLLLVRNLSNRSRNKFTVQQPFRQENVNFYVRVLVRL